MRTEQDRLDVQPNQTPPSAPEPESLQPVIMALQSISDRLGDIYDTLHSIESISQSLLKTSRK